MSFAQTRKKIISVSRSGFTLIELLVSIAIIGIMAGMVLYTLAGAQEDSLRNRTRGTIEKINAVILERWEGYRYRSVRFPIPQDFVQKKWISPRQVARLRALLVKDMMRMEMPDRYSDLSYTPTNLSFALGDGNTYTFESFGGRFPSREYNVLRNYFNLVTVPEPFSNGGTVVELTGKLRPAQADWTPANQSAECLYAIVSHSNSGGASAIESFHASEIGDTDGDSYPEFIDAWGNPIGWIRWPAAYPSVLNLSYKLPAASPASPDAFDPLRAFDPSQVTPNWNSAFTQKPWTLVPLIVSSGADGLFGIDSNLSSTPFALTRNVYAPNPDAPTVGSVTSNDEVADNVSNHDLLLE